MPIPARTVRVCVLPGGAGGCYRVTEVEVCYDEPEGFSIRDPCPAAKTSGPSLKNAMDERVAARGWRRSGDWQSVDGLLPWRGWTAPIEPIPEEA